MRAFPLAFLLASSALAGCLEPAASPAPGGAGEDTRAPDSASGATPPANDAPPANATVATGPAWAFTDTTGATRSRDSVAGAPSVLFFLATWCSSCRSRAAWLDDVAADFAGAGVRFLSVGQDPTESDAQLEAWADKYDHAWPHGVDKDRSVQRALGVTSQSSFVVLDRDGEIVRRFGYPGASESDLRASIERALGR